MISKDTIVVQSNCVLDIANLTISVHGNITKLTPRETRLPTILFSDSNHILLTVINGKPYLSGDYINNKLPKPPMSISFTHNDESITFTY